MNIRTHVKLETPLGQLHYEATRDTDTGHNSAVTLDLGTHHEFNLAEDEAAELLDDWMRSVPVAKRVAIFARLDEEFSQAVLKKTGVRLKPTKPLSKLACSTKQFAKRVGKGKR